MTSTNFDCFYENNAIFDELTVRDDPSNLQSVAHSLEQAALCLKQDNDSKHIENYLDTQLKEQLSDTEGFDEKEADAVVYPVGGGYQGGGLRGGRSIESDDEDERLLDLNHGDFDYDPLTALEGSEDGVVDEGSEAGESDSPENWSVPGLTDDDTDSEYDSSFTSDPDNIENNGVEHTARGHPRYTVDIGEDGYLTIVEHSANGIELIVRIVNLTGGLHDAN